MFKGKTEKLGAIFSVLLIFVVLYFLIRDIHYIQAIVLRSGIWTPLVALIFYVGLAATPISTDPLTIVLGSIYGPLIGTGIAWVGNTLSNMLEYYIGANINKKTNFDQIKDNLPLGLNILPVYSPIFLIFGRLIPFYGGKIVSILAGVYRVPLSRYVWTTVIVNIIGSVILSYGGFQLVTLFASKI